MHSTLAVARLYLILVRSQSPPRDPARRFRPLRLFERDQTTVTQNRKPIAQKAEGG
jgi:hypothetical protein